jgi:hypothetical protein
MITTQYKGQKLQIVPGKKGVVVAKVGGVIVATDCKTAQEARASAQRFIDELESGGDYAITPAPASVEVDKPVSLDEPEPTPEFVEVASGKKGRK